MPICNVSGHRYCGAKQALPGTARIPLVEGGSVRVAETGSLFPTLAGAIAATQNAGFDTFTLEVIGPVTETGDVVITANVTIVGAEGAHTVTMAISQPPYGFSVEGGGSLILGDGTSLNPLTILAGVRATNGTVSIRDGITVSYAGAATLLLSGPNVGGAISGGRLEGGAAALSMENGAQLSEISGGEFAGREDAILLSGAGTRLSIISNGTFYQTDPNTPIHGHGIFIQNGSQLGVISGGYFEAARNNALAITRGGWVDAIRGGEFVARRVGSSANNDRNATVRIEGEVSLTGIGAISGGHFHGGYFGLLSIARSFRAQIDSITGGVFEGAVALQNDVGSVILGISGGEFTGNQGMLNNGVIELIGGNAEIHGTALSAGYGIYNYTNGQIDEVGGGSILSESDHAIMNSGTITLISGGTIIGGLSAISCIGLNRGRLGTILGGVFWGRNGAAILLAYSMVLEPGLNSLKGLGRYWGSGGEAFNDESLVAYPYNEQFSAYYLMSTETEPVAGIPGVEFKYLVLDVDAYTVTVFGSYGYNSGAGVYLEGETVAINAGNREGYAFTGWVVNSGGVTLADADSPITTFIMPANDVTVTASWVANLFTVTFVDWDGTVLSAEQVAYGESATAPPAPTRPGYTFMGWDRPYTNVQADITVTAQYAPAALPTPQVAIGAKKVVRGACLRAGMFTFVVCDKNGREVARATNDRIGDVLFLLDTLNQGGVYRFTVREMNDSGRGWGMDTRCYPVIVIVRDNGLGQLMADVRYPKGKPVFVNCFCFSYKHRSKKLETGALVYPPH